MWGLPCEPNMEKGVSEYPPSAVVKPEQEIKDGGEVVYPATRCGPKLAAIAKHASKTILSPLLAPSKGYHLHLLL